jgi:hypothetical protein
VSLYTALPEQALSLLPISSDPSSLPDDSTSGTISHGPYQGSSVPTATVTSTDLCHKGENGYTTTINMLPDDVLLEIFDLCRQDPKFTCFLVWGPNGLVHVCQRWRQLVFGSPCRLDLQLPCTHGTPVRQVLGCWPPLPINISFSDLTGLTPDDENSLFTALEHPDRIRQVCLNLTDPLLSKVIMAMQQQFPVLTHLTLEWDGHMYNDDDHPTLPSGFLGGSAPCLQYMHLNGIPFLGLPILLSSTSDLVHLYLNDIPQEGYISPEALVACLVALPRLEFLHFEFKLAISHPDRICTPPMTRILLPALTSFEFRGDGEYAADLVSRIDCPRLNKIYITYLRWPFDLQVAQLFQFIDRSEDPKLALIRHAYVNVSHHRVSLDMYPCIGNRADRDRVNILAQCPPMDRQNSYLAQLFHQPSALLSRVAHLKLYQYRADEGYRTDEWLPVLHRFSATRTLYVYGNFTKDITYTLEHIAEMDAEVLPVLDLIHIKDEPVPSIEKFLAARKLSGRPVTVFDTIAEFFERAKSYISE